MVIDMSLAADQTAVVVGQPVTFTATIIYNYDQFPLVFGPGTSFGTSVNYVIYSDPGNQVALLSYSASVTFTYLEPGTYHPSVVAGYSISEYENTLHYYCSVCGGYGTIIADGPMITVSVPEPATAMLLSFALLLVMLPRKLLGR